VELLAPEAVGVDSSRRDGRGPAHWAARHGHTAVLSRLLEWDGAPFGTANARTTNGTTMLMLACFGGHVETAKALIRAGARLDDRNAWDCDVVCTAQLRVVGFRLMNVQRC
jgi:ankyrin repeat protein